MPLAINLLTFILILVCLFLGLLILVQLPKKEAGMGAAFGADTTAALFGAGSGNALTSMTKWSAGLFLVLCLLISGLTAYQSKNSGKGVRQLLDKTTAGAVTPAAAAPVSAATSATSAIPAVPLTPAAPAK